MEYLYHGSPKKNIKEFSPQACDGYPFESLVYATSDIVLASIFTLNVGGKFSTGRFGEVWHVVISESRESVLQNDQGGSIYYFPRDVFRQEPRSDLKSLEWISPIVVKPSKEMTHNSSVDLVLACKVQIYFVDLELRKYINSLPDHGRSILKTIQSENQLRNVNILEF